MMDMLEVVLGAGLALLGVITGALLRGGVPKRPTRG